MQFKFCGDNFLTMFGKELLLAYELPFTVSYPVFTPLHLFFVLNLLIISIILITQYCDKQAPHAIKELYASRPVQTLLLSVSSSSYPREETQHAENETQLSTELQATVDKTHAPNSSPAEEKSQFHHQTSIFEDFELDPARSQQQQKTEELLHSLDHRKQDQEKGRSEAEKEEENGAAASFERQKSEEKQLWSVEPERPLASTHFPHKKVTRAYTSKSPLKISRSSVTRKGDTLDATWKAICDDKRHSSPLRHHRLLATRTKKPDVACESEQAPISPVKQRQQMQSSSPSLVMRRRERSMTREELHARVESFISRFNEQIKIQRQQSLLRHESLDDRRLD